MTDQADAASELEEREREAVLLAHKARIAESMRGYDPSRPRYCGDCGDLIQAERLRIYPMTGRCTTCSAAAETRLRRPRHG